MSSLLIELRYVTRKLLASPAFTTITVLTLALGIGANAAIFSLVNTVLLRPLPYPDSHRLVALNHTAPGLDLPVMPQSDATYLLYRDHAESLDAVALYNETTVTVTGDGTPVRIAAARVSPSLFRVLGVAQIAGRLFTADEELPSAPAVAVIGEDLLARRFGGDLSVLGSTITLDGEAVEIVGVVAADFDFPEPDVEIWIPGPVDPDNAPLGSFSSEGIGRLRAGVSVAEAQAELATMMADLNEVFPQDPAAGVLQGSGFAPVVVPLRDEVVGDVGNVLWLLLGAVGSLLLIACANVANLFLVRTEGRQREAAIRTALGASRASLVRGLVLESTLLGLLGGGAGLLLAALGLRLLIRLEPGNIPRLYELSVDAATLVFTFFLSLLAGLVFGLLPALRSVSPRLVAFLKEGGRTSVGRERHRARQLLVALQVALALVLLVGCGLMVRSFAHLSRVDPGLEAEGVLTFQLFLPQARYAGDAARASFHQTLMARLETLPGVASVGGIAQPPLTGTGNGGGFELEEFPLDDDDLPLLIYFRSTAPGYFETLGIDVLEGRTFTRSDVEQRSPVVLVNEALARHYWPDESAVGKRLVPGRGAAEESWMTIVGVVGSVRNDGLHRPPPEMVYYSLVSPDPQNEFDVRTLTYVVRTDGEPSRLSAQVRDEVWALDANLPIANLQPMSELLAANTARWSFTLVLLVIAASVALLLGSVGLYGVVAYVVTQRTSELGIRLALGARRRQVTALVLRQGLLVTLLGLVPGLFFALLLTRWMQALLFEVSPLDPLTFSVVPLLLFAVALLASLLPAHRAGRVDPIVALRHE